MRCVAGDAARKEAERCESLTRCDGSALRQRSTSRTKHGRSLARRPRQKDHARRVASGSGTATHRRPRRSPPCRRSARGDGRAIGTRTESFAPSDGAAKRSSLPSMATPNAGSAATSCLNGARSLTRTAKRSRVDRAPLRGTRHSRGARRCERDVAMPVRRVRLRRGDGVCQRTLLLRGLSARGA